MGHLKSRMRNLFFHKAHYNTVAFTWKSFHVKYVSKTFTDVLHHRNFYIQEKLTSLRVSPVRPARTAPVMVYQNQQDCVTPAGTVPSVLISNNPLHQKEACVLQVGFHCDKHSGAFLGDSQSNLMHLGMVWDHVAKWIGCWTQDQKVMGSIASADHVMKCQAYFSFHPASAYPAVMGTWWTKVVVFECLKLHGDLYYM